MSNSSDYKHIKDIGEGAYGRAVLAIDSKGKECVVKVIDVTKLSQKDKMDCVREVKLLAKLDHPFIVQYLDSFIEGNNLNIVMNYCSGGDLTTRIRERQESGKPFRESTIIKWLAELLIAVKHIHAHKIIHRDIKSQNILTDKDGRSRLADFGISRPLETTCALAKTFIGTPSYLSPELCQGNSYGPPSDIWAVGCVAYELTTFKTPFANAVNLPDLCFKICSAPIASIPKFYSADLQKIITRTLDRNAKTRATATELLELPQMQETIRSMLKASSSSRNSTRASA